MSLTETVPEVWKRCYIYRKIKSRFVLGQAAPDQDGFLHVAKGNNSTKKHLLKGKHLKLKNDFKTQIHNSIILASFIWKFRMFRNFNILKNKILLLRFSPPKTIRGNSIWNNTKITYMTCYVFRKNKRQKKICSGVSKLFKVYFITARLTCFIDL